MTLDELLAREAIRHTLAAYNKAGDEDDAEAFAGCFTEDAVMESVAFRHEGRAAIQAWKAAAGIFTATGRTAGFRVHHVSSIHIELTSAEQASVRSCWFVITDIGPDHSGLYHDRFSKVGDRWLIAQRTIDMVWRAEDSFVAANLVGWKSRPGP